MGVLMLHLFVALAQGDGDLAAAAEWPVPD
jgi:hypothetical protein